MLPSHAHGSKLKDESSGDFNFETAPIAGNAATETQCKVLKLLIRCISVTHKGCGNNG